MAKDLAIVLNNGSINSAVTTALAAQKYRPVLLYIEAVSSTGSRQKQAYDMQVGHFKPYREHTVSLPFLDSMTERAPATAPTDPRLPTPVGPTLAHLLPMISVAATYAGNYQAAAIYCGLRIGPTADELAQATEFVQVWNELLQQPCGLGELEVVTPLMELDLWQVIDVGCQVGAPFDRTWSCFDSASEPCWACSRCRAREAAFQQAGKPDPLRVVKKN